MFRRFGSRFAIASAVTLAVIGTVAAAGTAQAATVGPGQYFAGQVFGNTAQSIIQVACGPIQSMGHPLAGQTVEVAELVPVAANVGYTGDQAVEIDATLTFNTSAANGIRIATFTQYFLKLPIPTDILVPCEGAGLMSFSPYPLDSGRPSLVPVTFMSLPVTG